MTKDEDTFFYTSMKNIMQNTIESIKSRYNYRTSNPDYIDTGFCSMDFHRGDLIVISSRPSIVKTAFTLSLINQIAINRKIPVGYISLSGTEESLFGKRLISINSGLPLVRINIGMLKTSEMGKFHESTSVLWKAPIYLISEPNINFDIFEWKAKRMIEERQVQLIILNGFELFEELVDSEKEDYRYNLRSILEKLKKLAVELNIPVLLEIDLPSVEQDDEPTLQDFKKNMIIPYMADMVLLIHRNRLRNEIEKQEAKLNIAKNNRGCAGVDIPVTFNLKTAAFYMEKEE